MTRRDLARKLAADAVQAGAPLAWFEELYAQAKGEPALVPWADLAPNPNLAHWLTRRPIAGSGRSALVVGCGLGDDAEALAKLGLRVTAFDISATCIDWCRQRFPDSAVEYCVADLFDLPIAWKRSFDDVFEVYTLQTMPADLRRSALQRVADCVASDGTLLIITRGRDESDDHGQMPWPLVRAELDCLGDFGLTEVSFDDYVEVEKPPVRRFRAEYRRIGASTPPGRRQA